MRSVRCNAARDFCQGSALSSTGYVESAGASACIVVKQHSPGLSPQEFLTFARLRVREISQLVVIHRALVEDLSVVACRLVARFPILRCRLCAGIVLLRAA